MPKAKNQNLKILYIADYFLKMSDENAPIKVSDVIDYLEEKGISAEAHSVYRDIALLRDEYIPEEGFEFKIDGKRGGYYYLAKRPIANEDLQLLQDAVASMSCLSADRAEELQDKLKNLGTRESESILSVDTKFYNRSKKTDEVLLSNNREIKRAIANDKVISFKYMRYNAEKMPHKVARRRGIRYHVSPFELFYKDGNYYIIGYEEAVDRINTYRVDRMKDLIVERDKRIGKDKYSEIDVQSYIANSFNMFGGNPEVVSVEFDNRLIDAVADKLGTGKEVKYESQENGKFIVTAKLEISSQFYAWICGFGSDARIVKPANVVQGMKDFLNKVCVLYESGEE